MNTPQIIFHGDKMDSLSFEGLEVNSPEYKRVANRRFYHKNKQTEKIRTKKWRLENPEKYKAWAEKNKEKRQAASRKYEYNISPELFEAKKLKQDNKCAICRSEEFLVVDHNHLCCPRKRGPNRKTCGNCNRGLLCRSCNTFIGLAKESEEILQSAIQYLTQYKGQYQ